MAADLTTDQATYQNSLPDLNKETTEVNYCLVVCLALPHPISHIDYKNIVLKRKKYFSPNHLNE